MGFKVTVHKNGAKHGEMHYSSEAVAVGMANKMRNAGAEASVARCNGTGCGCVNANPRRRTSTRAASDSLFALEATIRQTEAMLPAAAVRAAREESGWSSGVMAMASRSEMESYLRELRRTLKANPRRRNGAKLPAGWKVYLVGKHRVEATKNGVLMAARNVGDGWIGLRGPNYALPPMGVMKEGNTLLTGSPFAANRRRNGTTSANLAASRSLARGLMRNGAKVDAYVPAYLSVPRHGGNVILAQRPTDAMPTMVGIGNAPTALQRRQYAGCILSVVPASSIKRHRIGG